MLSNDGLSVSDALALGNGGFGDGFGGGNGAWWLIILILVFGGGNWFGGNNSNFNACCTPATAQGVTDAFNFTAVESDIRGVDSSINALTNALTSMHGDTMLGFANNINNNQLLTSNLALQLQQGFCDINKGLCEQNYVNQAGFNGVMNMLDKNSCDILRGQQDLQYSIATANSKTITAIDALGDRMIDYWTQNEITRLRNELLEARFQNSQQAQTDSIVNTLMPVAKPAYITCNPFAAAYGNIGNNGCGCGCGY